MKPNWLLVVLILFLFVSCKDENPGDPPVVTVPVAGQRINCIAIDQNGSKWIGTGSGLYMYDNKNWFTDTTFKNVGINTLVSNTGSLYIATAKGAYTAQVTGGKSIIVETHNQSRPGCPFNAANAYDMGLGNRKWFGVPAGLALYDGSKYLQNKNISLNLVAISNANCMAFRKNDGFFGTLGKYLYHVRYNPATDAITGASQMLGGADNPSHNYNGELTTDTIFCVAASADSSIWFGSLKGLTRNIGETKVGNGVFEYFLHGERVHCVYEFSDGKIWAGTENGYFVRSGNAWTQTTIADGLPGNIILSIAEDTDGSIWIGTDKGLSHLQGGKFTNY
jgi:ligand-binding sensor domain-containing protein